MAENGPDNGLRITTAAELLKAVELGVIDRTEARAMLGLPIKRGRLAKLQPRRGGRFIKGDLVYPLNRFSASAQRAMIEAQDLASAEERAHVETGDMLLAVFRQADGAGGRALRSIGVSEEQVRSKLEDRGRKEDVLEDTGPTSQLKTAIETAFHQVAYPGQVGTWHLVLSLASCEGRAHDALAQLGAQERVLHAMTDQFSTGDD